MSFCSIICTKKYNHYFVFYLDVEHAVNVSLKKGDQIIQHALFPQFDLFKYKIMDSQPHNK